MKRVSGLLTLCAMFGFMMAGCSVETTPSDSGTDTTTVDHGAAGAPMHGDDMSGGAEHSHDATGGETGDTPAGDTPAGDAPTGDTPAGDTPAGDTPAGDAPTGDDAGTEENTTPE